MNKTDMGKFVLWMCGVFPQWKPDPAVAATWAPELPDITADTAKNAVRSLMAKKPSPFPPSVFEIIAELSQDKPLSGQRAWERLIDNVRRKGVHAYPYEGMSEKERKAVQLMGGINVIGNSQQGDPFIEKKFLGIWNDMDIEKRVELVDKKVMDKLFNREVKQIA